jgi:pimeloyl-ACP methyl ester carboxylesterase
MAFEGSAPHQLKKPSPVPRRAAVALAVVAALLALTYGTISLLAAHSLTSPRVRAHVVAPTALGPSPARWSVQTEDGLTLRGWYVRADPPENNRSLVILLHGLWMNWDEVSGPASGLRARGYDVLVFDLRGHGESDPDRETMGRRERRDVRAALRWAIEKGYTPEQIAWVGFSLGGSTLLMEAAENPEIRRAVIDSPFGDLPAVLSTQLSKHSGLPAAFNPGILAAAQWAFGVRTDDLVPIRSARRWGDRPLLILHGTADATVSVEQSEAIAQVVGPACTCVIVPGVDHVKAYQSNPQAYVDRIDHFLQTDHQR